MISSLAIRWKRLWICGLLCGSAAGFLVCRFLERPRAALAIVSFQWPASLDGVPAFLTAICLKVLLLTLTLSVLRRSPLLAPTGLFLLLFRGFSYGWVLSSVACPPWQIGVSLAVYLAENVLLLCLLCVLNDPKGHPLPWIGGWLLLRILAVLILFSP